MPALKRLALLALLAGCEGPTLYVGDLELAFDAGAADASDEDARMIVRDAQLGDGGWILVAVRCKENDDCRGTPWPRCNTNFFFCTECQFDRDCRQGEYCDMSPYTWRCRDERKDDGPMGGGP